MSDRPPAPAPAPAQPPPPEGPAPPPAAPLSPPAAGAGRRVVRRVHDRLLAGVAGGIADHLGVSAWVVRIGFLVLVPFGGVGVLAYLAGWLLIPAAGSPQPLAAGALRGSGGLRTTFGVALILVAVAILASAFSEPALIWAVALIAFGIFLFRQEDPQPDHRPPPGQRPPSGGGPVAAAAPPVAAEPPAAARTEPLPAPLAPDPGPAQRPGALPADLPVWAPPPLPPDAVTAWGAPPPRAPRRRPFLGPLTFAAALIATALAITLDNLGVVDLGVGQILAVFLTVLGLGLLVGAWRGRAWGLIPVGLLMVPVVALTALAGPVPVEGGVADRTFQPRSPAEVRSSYRLAGGELILDLSRVRFGPGQPPIRASVAGGRLLVVVPDQVAAEVRGRVGVGSLDLLGHEDVGAQVDATVTEPPAKPPAKGATAPTVRLDLMAGYGVVEVRRASDPRPLDDVGPPGPTLAPPATLPEEP